MSCCACMKPWAGCITSTALSRSRSRPSSTPWSWPITPQRSARAKSNLGLVYAQTGDEHGRELLEAAIQELDPQTDPLELARVNSRLGRFHHLHADWSRAVEYLERARQLAEPLDDVAGLSEIYAYLSGAYQQWGRWEQSIYWAHQAVALGKRTGSLVAEALGYEFLAEDSQAICEWQGGAGLCRTRPADRREDRLAAAHRLGLFCHCPHL